MAIAGVNGLIGLYILEKSNITNKISDIMMEITNATRETAGLASETSALKEEAKEQYGEKTEAYYDAVDEIQYDYQLQLAEITSWENELEVQKDEYKVQLEMISGYMESFQSMQKNNIKKDFAYGQGT